MAQEPPAKPPPPPQWVIDLNASPRPKPKSNNFSNPPGYVESSSGKRTATSSKTPTRKPPTLAETDTLKLKKSWELALAPAKALPMNAIMMYMSGNSLQIFSIMMVFMLFKNPLTGIMSTNEAFRRYETEGTRKWLWSVKAVYVLMNCLALALGIWKVNGMGLLPTTRSDWLAWETERVPLQRAVFAFR
ncbi:ER membrane protein complex subunit 4, partial [Lecanoromycetidae sp. Uapishka_2]